MKRFEEKNILVVGLGRSGLAATKYLLREGATVRITDRRTKSELSEVLTDLKNFVGVEQPMPLLELGSHPKDIFERADMIVLSPGVPTDIEGVQSARKKGVPVVCELELGLPLLKGKVIGITGTNGKSTTTKLIGEFLKTADIPVWVGGNIGDPLIGGINEAMEKDFVVLELSSYQLELTPSLQSHIAIFLNVTPDHLDRYLTFESYVDAKTNIGMSQGEGDWIIYNAADPIVKKKISSYQSKKVPFSVVTELKDGGWVGSEGVLHTRINGNDDSFDLKQTLLKGVHNRENIAAAVLAAKIAGVDNDSIKATLETFPGLPHRLQLVRELEGVSYYNDSKGTNTGAVKRSLESFDEPVVLIAGGLDKNTGYDDLRETVKRKVRCIVAIGEAASRIKGELGGIVDVIITSSLEEAIALARSRSIPGDVILLSPACASFDMFKDYAERGRKFEALVMGLI